MHMFPVDITLDQNPAPAPHQYLKKEHAKSTFCWQIYIYSTFLQYIYSPVFGLCGHMAAAILLAWLNQPHPLHTCCWRPGDASEVALQQPTQPQIHHGMIYIYNIYPTILINFFYHLQEAMSVGQEWKGVSNID